MQYFCHRAAGFFLLAKFGEAECQGEIVMDRHLFLAEPNIPGASHDEQAVLRYVCLHTKLLNLFDEPRMCLGTDLLCDGDPSLLVCSL
jgi:hypothetical protein